MNILESGSRTYFNDAGWDQSEYRIIKVGHILYEFFWDEEHHYGPTMRIYQLAVGCPDVNELDWEGDLHVCNENCDEEIAYEDPNGIPYYRWARSRETSMTFREWYTLTPEEMIERGFGEISH